MDSEKNTKIITNTNSRLNLTAASGDLDNVDSELADTGNRIETANNRIESLKRRIQALKRAAEQLRLDAMNLKEISLGGKLAKVNVACLVVKFIARGRVCHAGVLFISSFLPCYQLLHRHKNISITKAIPCL